MEIAINFQKPLSEVRQDAQAAQVTLKRNHVTLVQRVLPHFSSNLINLQHHLQQQQQTQRKSINEIDPQSLNRLHRFICKAPSTQCNGALYKKKHANEMQTISWLADEYSCHRSLCMFYVRFFPPLLSRFAFSTTSCKAFAHNIPWLGAILSGKRVCLRTSVQDTFLARAAAKWTQSSHHHRLFVYFFVSPSLLT